MRAKVAFGVLLAVGLGLAVTSSAGKPAAVKEIPVTVTIADGNAITGDDYGSYTDGVDGVSAVLVPLGNLAMKTNANRSSLLRTLRLNFMWGCVDPCTAPWGELEVPAFVSTSSCDNPGGLRDMEPGSSPQACNLNVNFGADGLGWFLRFGQDWGTTPATVVHSQDGSWTIDVPAGGLAKLLSYPTRGRMVLTDRGDYVMPVHMTVEVLP